MVPIERDKDRVPLAADGDLRLRRGRCPLTHEHSPQLIEIDAVVLVRVEPLECNQRCLDRVRLVAIEIGVRVLVEPGKLRFSRLAGIVWRGCTIVERERQGQAWRFEIRLAARGARRDARPQIGVRFWLDHERRFRIVAVGRVALGEMSRDRQIGRAAGQRDDFIELAE